MNKGLKWCKKKKKMWGEMNGIRFSEIEQGEDIQPGRPKNQA